MVTTLNRTETDRNITSVTRLEDEIKEIVVASIEAVRSQLSIFEKDYRLEDLFKNHNFVDRFKYTISEHVSQILSDNDKNINEIHIYDPSTNPDSESGDYLPIDAPIHMLIVVDTPSASLKALASSLDRALISSMKNLPAPLYKKLESMLDILFITPEDVENRTGYAALLTSIYAPSIKVWQRS